MYTILEPWGAKYTIFLPERFRREVENHLPKKKDLYFSDCIGDIMKMNITVIFNTYYV